MQLAAVNYDAIARIWITASNGKLLAGVLGRPIQTHFRQRLPKQGHELHGPAGREDHNTVLRTTAEILWRDVIEDEHIIYMGLRQHASNRFQALSLSLSEARTEDVGLQAARVKRGNCRVDADNVFFDEFPCVANVLGIEDVR